MTPEASQILYELIVECGLSNEEIRLADQFEPHQLPFYWWYLNERAPGNIHARPSDPLPNGAPSCTL